MYLLPTGFLCCAWFSFAMEKFNFCPSKTQVKKKKILCGFIRISRSSRNWDGKSHHIAEYFLFFSLKQTSTSDITSNKNFSSPVWFFFSLLVEWKHAQVKSECKGTKNRTVRNISRENSWDRAVYEVLSQSITFIQYRGIWFHYITGHPFNEVILICLYFSWLYFLFHCCLVPLPTSLEQSAYIKWEN